MSLASTGESSQPLPPSPHKALMFLPLPLLEDVADCRLSYPQCIFSGTPSQFVHATEWVHGDLGSLRENDVVVLLSHSGNTHECAAILPHLKVMLVLQSSWLSSCKELNYICRSAANLRSLVFALSS